MNQVLNSPPIKDKFIIFLHIQKTGGITLQRVLRRKLGKSLPERFIGLLHPKDQPDTILETLQQKTPNDRYVIGHFCYGIDQYLPQPSTYMAFLREPVSRVISLYDYSKHNPTAYYHQYAVDKSLAEFALESSLMELDNGQTRFIAGDKQDCFINRTPVGECDQSLLDRAIQNIQNDFSLIGLTEYFDQSLLLLKELMGWQSCLYLRRNTAQKQAKNPVSQSLKDQIKAKNHLDVKLYEYAAQHLKTQLAEFDLDNPAIVEEFRQKNASFNQFFGRAYSVYDFGKALVRGELGRPS